MTNIIHPRTGRPINYSRADHCEKQYLDAFKRGDQEAMLYWARREAHILKLLET